MQKALFAAFEARQSPLVLEPEVVAFANWLSRKKRKRKGPHDPRDEAFECGGRLRKRCSIATSPLSTDTLHNASQSPVPRPFPVPCKIEFSELFSRQNFGHMEDGLLKECFHKDQSRVLLDDLSHLRREGYVHWKDDVVGASIGMMSQDSFWTSDGWGILNSVLANPRLSKILKESFPHEKRLLILHWMWWGQSSTHALPIFHARSVTEPLGNSCSGFPSLGLHISCPIADIKYYARSHQRAWPAPRAVWFTNSQEALQGYSLTEGLSNG